MKKTFCVLLAFLMLLPFCPVNSAVASLSNASLAFDGGGLVTLGRPYTVSLGQAAYCSGNGDDLGIKLTDYRFAGAISPQPEEEWVGFDAAGAGLGGNGAVLLLRGFRRVFDERHLSAE